MAENDLHMTKSHLLRKLLQRRVEMLENEKAELKREVSRLEERLLSQQANSPSPSSGMQEIVDETLDSIRALSAQAKHEADFTLKLTRNEQEKLVAEMATLREEGEQLTRLLLEAIEGVNAIYEQAQTRTALLVKGAHLQQEKMMLEVEGLYNGRETSSTLLTEKRQRIFAIREYAQTETARLAEEAQEVRSHLVAEVKALRKESRQLKAAMAQVIEHVRTMSEWTYLGASRAIQEEVGPRRVAQPQPSLEDAAPTEAGPRQAEAVKTSIGRQSERGNFNWTAVFLSLILLATLPLPRVATMLPAPQSEMLFDYRYLIWIVGGPFTYWLLLSLRRWEQDARLGMWKAERDYALWRIRNALLALALLVPLLVLTTVVALR